MRGSKHIVISNRYAKFDFILVRNITILRDDTGTGKTTLFNMIVDYTRDREQSGVSISSPCPCVALIDLDWKNQLQNVHESVVFIDEDFNTKYLNTKVFAEAVNGSDNYFVLITREDLHDLPYSIEEIYEIKTSGKFHSFRKLYKGKTDSGYYIDKTAKTPYDAILTEDSKAGFQFFRAVFEEQGKDCKPAGANPSVYTKILEDREKKLLVIADGAAFGAEIDRVLKLERSGFRVALYLPESFEWLILKSGLIKDKDVSQILENSSEYIDSEHYLSWERFFTALLTERTKDNYLAYTKTKLNQNYLTEREKKQSSDFCPARNNRNHH